MIQLCVAAVGDVPVVLCILPVVGAMLCCLVVYAVTVAVYMASAAGGHYDPSVGAFSPTSTSPDKAISRCSAEVEAQLHPTRYCPQ